MQRRCLIIEDADNAFNELKDIITDIPSLTLVPNNGVSKNINQAITYIEEKPDIIFLDNELGNQREASIAFLNKLWEFYQEPQNVHLKKPVVILCSNYFDIDQVPNVLINQLQLRVRDSIKKIELSREKVLSVLDNLKNDGLLLEPSIVLEYKLWSYEAAGFSRTIIQSSEILFIATSIPNYVTIYKIPNINPDYQNILRQRRIRIGHELATQNPHSTYFSIERLQTQIGVEFLCEAYTIRATITELAGVLPNLTFIQTHQSYIINRIQISDTINQSVIFRDSSIYLGNCISNNSLRGGHK